MHLGSYWYFLSVLNFINDIPNLEFGDFFHVKRTRPCGSIYKQITKMNDQVPLSPLVAWSEKHHDLPSRQARNLAGKEKIGLNQNLYFEERPNFQNVLSFIWYKVLIHFFRLKKTFFFIFVRVFTFFRF